METLTPIEWRVLEVAAGTPGNLEHLYQRLHVPLADAADAVRSLVEKGLIESKPDDPATAPKSDDPSRYWRAKFEPTGQGQEILQATAGKPPARRSLFGIFAGRIPDIPFEVFKENRRDMAAETVTENGIKAELPRRRSLYGVFKDRNIRLTREDVDEARREMWGAFAEDDS